MWRAWAMVNTTLRTVIYIITAGVAPPIAGNQPLKERVNIVISPLVLTLKRVSTEGKRRYYPPLSFT
jgi:hypothetical protein